MAYTHLIFPSKYLGRETDVNIILPDRPGAADPAEYYGSGKKYKVAWMLHGAFGSYTDWLHKTNIELYAEQRDLIVVMPEGLNSGYSNIEMGFSRYDMFDFLTKELMPLVYGWLPASSAREDNFMCGLSMGGDGSLKYAVNNPELFAGCAVLSMTPVPLYDEKGEMPMRVKTKVKRLGGVENYLASYENVWERLERIPSAEMPKLYVACGEKDSEVYPNYLRFKRHIEAIGHEARFESFPEYGHEWPLWDAAILRAFDYFGIEKK